MKKVKQGDKFSTALSSLMWQGTRSCGPVALGRRRLSPLPTQERTPMISWPLQLPGKKLRIPSLLQAKRPMQKLQSKLQVPGPKNASFLIHGVSTFLRKEGHNLDYDQECFARANVAYSRATDITILACPLNMQGMPGALQFPAALLHGVQTI